MIFFILVLSSYKIILFFITRYTLFLMNLYHFVFNFPMARPLVIVFIVSALDLVQRTENGEQIRAGNCPCQAFFSLLYFFIVAGSVIISRLGAAMAFMSLLHFIVIIFTCRICSVYSGQHPQHPRPPTQLPSPIDSLHIFRWKHP